MKIEHPEGLKCSKCGTVIDSTHMVIFQNLEDGTINCFKCRFKKREKLKLYIVDDLEEQHPMTEEKKKKLKKWYNKCIKHTPPDKL